MHLDWDAIIVDATNDKNDNKYNIKKNVWLSASQNFDVDLVSSLPPTERKDWIEEAKKKRRLKSRQEFMQLAYDPKALSQCQLRNFLKSTKLNKDITKMAREAAKNEGLSIVSASDQTKTIVFEKESDLVDSDQEHEEPIGLKRKRRFTKVGHDSDENDDDNDNKMTSGSDLARAMKSLKPTTITTKSFKISAF